MSYITNCLTVFFLFKPTQYLLCGSQTKFKNGVPICLSRNIQRRNRHYTVPPILGIEVSRELWSASCFAVPDIPRFFKMGLLDMDFLDDVRRMNPRQVKNNQR